MSHFIVLVIGADIEKQLAPYDEDIREVFKDTTDEITKKYNEDSVSAIPVGNGTWNFAPVDKGGVETRFNAMFPTFEAFCKNWEGEEVNENGRYGYFYNPQAKWDWYRVGGRWSGYFKAKPGTKGKLGEKRWVSDEIKPGHYDVMRKGDIDFEGMMMNQRVLANERYDLYEKTVAGLEVPKLWVEYCKGFDNIADARAAFNALPYNVALRAAKLDNWFSDSVAVYGVGRYTYVKRAIYDTFIPYAVVQNGEWVTKGEMGWFGISNETVDENDWAKKISKMLFELPDDTLITAVNCHI